MIDVEPLINDSLDRLYPEAEPGENWNAILKDAGVGRGWVTEHRRLRVPRIVHRHVLATAVALLVFLAAGSALGVTLTHYLGHHSHWQALVNDYLDNARIDGRYSCSDARTAVAKIRSFDARGTNPHAGVRLPTQPFERYARSACR
jgi:hypothetical protein